MTQTPNTPPQAKQKKTYQPPALTKIGSLKSITLKSGSNSDSSMPRMV